MDSTAHAELGLVQAADSRGELIDLMEQMTNAGQIDHLLLGLDLGMRDYFRAYGGGPGLGYLMDVFVPRLRKRVGEAAVDAILVANAARAFAFARASESS